MADAVIENPILNSPYAEPDRHFRFAEDGITNLVLEVSGMPKKDKQAKASTARDLWIPAVNNHGGFGKWAYIETREPWDAIRAIRKFLV